MRDRAFWSVATTQFLGAFNDNLYKQLMLLLAIPVGAAAVSQQDQQDVATVVFSLPFVAFSGIAGFVSDRFSKSQIIVFSKVAEIVAMAMGMCAFLMYATTGYTGLMIVLFLMGLQSTFFGPGKYGILPELFRETDLPRANGIILMTTFLAILFGTVTAGVLGDQLVGETNKIRESAPNLWIGSAICIVIAIVGTMTSLIIRRVPPAQPKLQLKLESWAIPRETREFLWQDMSLVGAILASSVFWLVSGIAIQAVNSLGIVQLQKSKSETSIMAATIGLGIACGGVIAGRLSKGRANPRVSRFGLWGITATLLLLSISIPVEPIDDNGPAPVVEAQLADATLPPAPLRPEYSHLLGFGASLPILGLLGISAAMFAIPLQVFVQSRPPASQKGRMIAVMNQANFFAILLSGVVYGLFDALVVRLGWPRSPIFAMMAVLVLPLLIGYRPKFD